MFRKYCGLNTGLTTLLKHIIIRSDTKSNDIILKRGDFLKIEVPSFMSIREVAKTGLMSEYSLRLLEKQGKLPCIYAGKKCLINFELLVQQMNDLGGKEVTTE